jgi:alkylated DNA repair dioxygenase AlkB
MTRAARQLSLFGGGEPSIDAAFATQERIELGRGAWVDLVRGWVRGEDALFARLEAAMRWRAERRFMYERMVDVPRLFARVPEDGEADPMLDTMREALSRRYGPPFASTMLALYRNGDDSVAWHRDRGLRELDEAFVCVVSLGSRRRFALRPFGGGASTALTLGSGDLLVMGGTCQRSFEHCVPKMRVAGPRLAIMFR